MRSGARRAGNTRQGPQQFKNRADSTAGGIENEIHAPADEAAVSVRRKARAPANNNLLGIPGAARQTGREHDTRETGASGPVNFACSGQDA